MRAGCVYRPCCGRPTLVSGTVLIFLGTTASPAATDQTRQGPGVVEFLWMGKDADVAGTRGKTIRRRVPVGKGELLVARRGAARPTARIVLAANPTRSAQIAAAEFQHYVEKITGERLEVMTDEARPCKEGRILIGESALTSSPFTKWRCN